MTTDRHAGDERPEDQAAVLDFLQQAEPGMQRLDTHASIVFLGKDRVLKIKRAVRLPFLDYSTLDRSRQACQEELRVNRPYAPQIYRRITPITREADGLTIGGDGEPVEWAVEMSRFDETQGFDRIAAREEIAPEKAIALADVILAGHSRQRPVDGSGWLRSIAGIIERNTARFGTVHGLAASSIDRLDSQSRAALVKHGALLQTRAEAGFVRRCHGDLHLGNIVLIDGRPLLFDAIEFDPAIATTDVLYDLAFPLMDLLYFKAGAAANALFNRYMAEADDATLDALALLPLFLSMRAAIRAHVLFTKSELSEENGNSIRHDARRYFDLATALIDPAPPCMVAIGGLSGTGKSMLARGIAPMLGPPPGALVLRSDVIRKKLFGVNETERLPASAYTPDVTARVYAKLMADAARVALQGHSVILDAAFLRDAERASFATIPSAKTPHIGLFLTAERSVRVSRIENRSNDASDATASIAIQQEAMSLGTMEWHMIDAGGTPKETLARARDHVNLHGALVGEKP